MPSNDNLGPGPGPIILSSAGYVFRITEQAFVGGQGTYGGAVVTPVAPGGAVICTGTGDFPVKIAGSSGTLDVQLTTGAPGLPRAVAYLVDKSPSPTAYLGISLDASNRPYCIITDIYGNIRAETGPDGPSFPAGKPLHVTLTWDSRHAFNGTDFALFSINGTIPNLWVYEVTAPWVPFVPSLLLVGYGFGSDFNGTIGFVQGTNAGVEMVPTGVTPPQFEKMYFQAGSAVSGSLQADWKVAAAPAGNAAISASAKAGWKVAATVTAGSSVSAALTKSPP
jgi:hypothetical protein